MRGIDSVGIKGPKLLKRGATRKELKRKIVRDRGDGALYLVKAAAGSYIRLA